jgi:hypothetical protein
MVVFQLLYGLGNDRSIGLKVYWRSGFATEVVFSIGCDDAEGFQRDNFGRRDSVSRPVPVWHSQVLGCGNPTLFIHLVRVCDLESVLLHNLLDNMIDVSMMYEGH